MTEQEARDILNEALTENPQKKVGQRLYRLNTRLQAQGAPCVEVYRLTKSGKRAIFSHMTTRDDIAIHIDARDWLAGR